MDPRLSTSGLHQDFYKSQWFNQWNKICGEYDVRKFFHCPLSYTVTVLSLMFRHSLQQPAAEHARCMMISLDSIAAPLLSAQAYPLPLRVKLLSPLISETVLSQTTWHRVLQLHNKKIYIIWNKLYSFHTHEHFQFYKSCQDVFASSVVPGHVGMYITHLPLEGASPRDRTRCLWVIDIFAHFAPKVQTVQTAKTPFFHCYSFFRHTGRGLSNSEVSFTGCATLLSFQQKLKSASENKGVTSAT